MRVEVARGCASSRKLLDLPRRRHGVQAAPEARGDEAMEPLVRVERDERRWAAPERDDAGIDAGRGVERDARQPSRDDDLVRRAPDDALHAARPRQPELRRDAPLDHEIRADEAARRVVEQLVEDRGRLVERQVRDHREVFARERDREHVGLEHADVRPAAVQLRRPATVLLDREHAARGPRQLRRQAPAAGADVDDEIARADARLAHELRR